MLVALAIHGYFPAQGIKAKGEIRQQYHHSTGIVPTILNICDLSSDL